MTSFEQAEAEAADETWRWLASTVRLQEEAYGHVADPSDAAKTSASIKENVLALAVELLGELPREFHWKYWSHDEPWYRRERIIQECVDVGHFLANVLVAVGCTDAEWEAAYRAKQEVNRERQRRLYLVEHKPADADDEPNISDWSC